MILLLAAALTIPFEAHGRHLYLRATIGGETASLLLDTGSSVTALDSAWAQKHGIHPDDAKDGHAVGGGSARVPVKLAHAAAIALEGGVVLRDQPVALIPFDAVRAATGRDVRGTLGYDFFERYVVEIDRESHRLILHDPGRWRYAGKRAVIPVALDLRVPIVQATLVPRGGEKLQARLILDLGTGGLPLILATRFATAHDFPGPAVETALGSGVGGLSLGKVVRLDRAEVGSLLVKGPLAGLGRETKGFLGSGLADGTIGAPVFERGRTFVDYPHKQVIFEPGPSFDARFALDDRAGVVLAFDGGRAMVRYVVANGPAASAGVRENDELVKLDGTPVDNRPMDELRHALSADGTHELSLRRAGTTLAVSIIPRDLLP
jgi:hypothetical protein